MSRSSLLVLCVLALILLVAGTATWLLVGQRTAPPEPTGAAALRSNNTTDQSSAATYTDAAGEPVSLEAYLGKVVVVTTWASWCPQCRESLERADAAAETLDSAGISVLAINRTEPTARIERYPR